MSPSKRYDFLTFVAASVFIGLGMLVMVLSMTTPSADKLLAFLGGFTGPLLLGAMIPRVRRYLLESLSRAADDRQDQLPVPQPLHPVAPHLEPRAVITLPRPRRSRVSRYHRTNVDLRSSTRRD